MPRKVQESIQVRWYVQEGIEKYTSQMLCIGKYTSQMLCIGKDRKVQESIPVRKKNSKREYIEIHKVVGRK